MKNTRNYGEKRSTQRPLSPKDASSGLRSLPLLRPMIWRRATAISRLRLASSIQTTAPRQCALTAGRPPGKAGAGSFRQLLSFFASSIQPSRSAIAAPSTSRSVSRLLPGFGTPLRPRPNHHLPKESEELENGRRATCLRASCGLRLSNSVTNANFLHRPMTSSNPIGPPTPSTDS